VLRRICVPLSSRHKSKQRDAGSLLRVDSLYQEYTERAWYMRMGRLPTLTEETVVLQVSAASVFSPTEDQP
jgi:hypothetical protein